MLLIKRKELKRFDQIFNSIQSDFEFCLMGEGKTKTVYDEFISIGKKGITAEIGVFMGFTSKVIALSNGGSTHFCYDTFEGIAHVNSQIDVHQNGEFSCSLEKVKQSINLPNVIYKKGTFPETFAESNLEFIFVHSDTDTYHGTKTTFDNFAEIMCMGGKMLFDDYKWKNCPGVEKAVHEFLNVNNNFSFKEFTHQCVLTKIK